MAKLTQDEIKWILSIDAGGVQKEIAATSSEIQKLSAENRLMEKDMKAAEKQIKEQERIMQRLAKAGMEESSAYKEARATRNSARADINSYTVRIRENSRAIKENEKKLKELNEGMKLNEMSMKQLRARAAYLRKQLSVTSYAANPKEYKKLQKELSRVNRRMADVSGKGKGLIAQFASMNHPVGTAARAVQGFGQALRALLGNPVGLIIMAIAGAFMALKKAVSSSEENLNKFQQLTAPLKALFDALLLIIQKVAGAILDFALKAVESFTKIAEKIPFIGGHMQKLNEKSREAVAIEKEKQKLRVRERESLISNAKKESEIARLRNEAKQRDKFSNEQIIQKLDRAIQLEKEIAQEKIDQAKISLEILKAEAARAQNTEEVNRKIAEQTALLANLETEFFKKTTRLESERFSRIDEMRREDEQAAKEALERKISAVDYALKEETKLLKQQLASGTITREQYDRELEEKTLKSLREKLKIAGLNKDQRIEIEQQILDFKIKAVELEKQFEKEREELAKSWRSRFLADNEKELEALNEKYEKELEDLKKSLEKKAITEVEFLEYKQQLLEEKEKELAEKRKKQKEARAEKELAELMAQKELEKMALQQAYASGLITKEEYQNALLELDKRYSMQALSIENISAQSKIKIQQEMLDASTKIMEEETAKQKAEQDKRAKLYFQFSEQIGTMLGGFISGNEDMVKSSLKAILNMALDALEAQVTMSIASATAQSFAQSDSVATFGATGLTRAAILTGLIKAAFAGVKAAVNSALSGGASSPESSGSTTTTSRVVSGRESGGFIDVTREQDGKNYRALLQPKKRGFINRPTVIVGDGPAGESMEWVAGNDALKNPTILPVIQLMNEAQQAGTIRTIDLNHIMRARMAGFASGGFISNGALPDSGPNRASLQPPYNNVGYSNIEQVLNELKALLSYLKKYGIKSSVNYHEFKKADENIESIKKKARRN